MDVTEHGSTDMHSNWVSNDGAGTLATGVVSISTLLALCSGSLDMSYVLAMLTVRV